MKDLISFAVTVLVCRFRSRLSLHLEIAALRHQLSVYQRLGRRLIVDRSDRWLWALLALFGEGWRNALYFVQPRTVIQWQRQRFRAYWRGLSGRPRQGRPTISAELRRLIRRMWQANPTWGSPRIVAELHLLGIDVAKSTVEKYRPKMDRPRSVSWSTFLRQHLRETVSIDFFTVPTLSFRMLFVFVVLVYDRRRIVHFNVTEHPSAIWTAQQLVEAFPWNPPPRLLIRDRDGVYGHHFQKRVVGLGMQDLPIAPRCPWQNGYVERVIGSLRRECLDHCIVLDERHLKRLLRGYLGYYHTWRPHQSLNIQPPDGRKICDPEQGRVIEFPAVQGLHHYYLREAA